MIKGILGDQVQVIVFKNIQRWAFEKHAILSKLTKIQREKIIDSMKYVNHKENEVVFRAGPQAVIKIVVMIEGNLIYVAFCCGLKASSLRKKAGRSSSRKAWPGARTRCSRAPIKSGFREAGSRPFTRLPSFNDDVRISSDGVIAELDFVAFEALIGGPLGEIIKKNENTHEVAAAFRP